MMPHDGNKIIYDLDAVRDICRHLGNPQDKLKVIHIAGTNGKGSVGAFLQSILTSAGFKTGRFVSPAVFSPFEVFTIDGKAASEEEYNECINEVKNACGSWISRYPTEFETEAIAAMLWFLKKECDIVLIEAGMGGEYDATNIIEDKELCVITPIGLDHMSFLGDNIKEIARNKAGIIKRGSVCVTSEQISEAMEEIEKRCAELSVPLKKVDGYTVHEKNGSCEYIGLKNITPSLQGGYQIQNAALAVLAAVALKEKGYNIEDKAIYEGISGAVWSGRFEIINKEPMFIIDGAHNIDGIKALCGNLDRYSDNMVFITGVFADKEYDKMMELIAGRADYIYTVTPPSPRGLDTVELAKTIFKYNKNVMASDMDHAVNAALGSGKMIVAFGTLSILRDIKERVKEWKERIK